MNHIDAYKARAERFGRIVSGAAGAWNSPTPCTDWTAGDVVKHVIETEHDFLTRHDLTDVPMPVGDPGQAWQTHADQTLAALSADGVAERSYDGYFGPTTFGETMADFYGWDLEIHGWDIARATGQPDPFSDAEAVELDAATAAWGPALYSEGICAQPVQVPDDAGAAAKLLAKLGRDPNWTPPAD